MGSRVIALRAPVFHVRRRIRLTQEVDIRAAPHPLLLIYALLAKKMEREHETEIQTENRDVAPFAARSRRLPPARDPDWLTR